ncbi:MAG: MFS transporter [Acetobacteraceae bacterium]|nr:MFS transporter [Acetobacteraceae bacterium]
MPADATPNAIPATPTAASRAEMRGVFLRAFPSIVLPMFLASVDQTIVATALPNMAGSLGDVERISWVVVAYLMATTIAAPVYGRLGDVFGRKRLLVFALVLFILASLGCALAPTMLLLIGARVLQGCGGGGLMTLSQALVGEIVPPRERPRYQGYMASVFMCSSTVGPVLGGYLTQHFGWASVFTINLPLGLLAIVLALRLQTRAPTGSGFRFDFLGLGLLAGFVIPLLLALERLQQISLTGLPVAIGLIVFAAASLWLLLKQERRSASPLIPVKVLRDPSIWRADAMGACVGAMIVGGVTFMPIYLQVVRGADPAHVGLMMLPLTAGIAIGSLSTGRLISRTGRTAIFPSIGQIVVAAAWSFLAIAADSIPFAWLPAVFAVISLFTGTTMPVVQMTVQIVAGRSNLGAASASVQFMRSIGAALGTAVIGAVLFAVLSARDTKMAALFADVVERGPQVLDQVAPAVRTALAQEITGAFRGAFLAIACFSLIAMGLAWTLPMRRL